MTYVGKIFVVVIMVFSLVFLTLSTVVFMTERDWKAEVDKLQTKIGDTNKELGNLKDQKATLEQQLIAARRQRETDVDGLNKTITQLKADVEARTNEITSQRDQVERSMEAARAAQQVAAAKDTEISDVRKQLEAAQTRENEWVQNKKSLQDTIFNTKRKLDEATAKFDQLQNSQLTLKTVLRSRGLSDDPESYAGVVGESGPPDVEGKILQVDPTNRRMQISIGADDGVKIGHEFVVYRREPQPEYLGKVRVQSVENDQAVVRVIGQTPQGKKIQGGDIVATTIR